MLPLLLLLCSSRHPSDAKPWLIALHFYALASYADTWQITTTENKDDFGIPRPGFYGAKDFLVPSRYKPGQQRLFSVYICQLNTSSHEGNQTADTLFYWCDKAETALALLHSVTTKRCKLQIYFTPPSGYLGLIRLSKEKEHREYGEHVILAAQKNSTYYYQAELVAPPAHKSGGVRWCRQDGAVHEYAAFNRRPHCHPGPNERAAYKETQGRGILFKPSVSVRVASAYHCTLLETRIETTHWFTGERTSNTRRVRRSVLPGVCRRWAITKKCDYGQMTSAGRAFLHRWETRNPDTYTYRWPQHLSYKVYNCIVTQGTVRTRPPYSRLVSSHLGELPARYRPGNSTNAFWVRNSGTLVWDPIRDDRLCPYTQSLRMRSLVMKKYGDGLLNFVCQETLMTFSARGKDTLLSSADSCLFRQGYWPGLDPSKTLYVALNQDLILAFSADENQRTRRDLLQYQLMFASAQLSEDLLGLGNNLARAWCLTQQTAYDLQLRSAGLDASATMSEFYGRDIKASARGDVFAVYQCETITPDRLTVIPSLRTDYDPVLYRSLNVPVNSNRCFSRPIVSFWTAGQNRSEQVPASNLTAITYGQVTPQRELSLLFPYTKTCDGADEFFFDLGGDLLYHFVHNELAGTHNKSLLTHHGHTAWCAMNMSSNASDECQSQQSTASIRLIDPERKLDQKMTEHLEFGSLDPLLYSRAEMKSYFALADPSTAIAFLQAYKEAIYHCASRLALASLDGAPGAGSVFETLAGVVGGTVTGLLGAAAKGVGDFLHWLFGDAAFRIFLIVCSIGGLLVWVELWFMALSCLLVEFRRHRSETSPDYLN